MRCWGYGGNGQLGYGNTDTIGEDETPASVGPVNLGGHSVKAIATGDYHTCAILDDGSVRCWGFGGDGRLGYGSTNDVRDPSQAGPVNLGLGRTAVAITAGAAHTCAILDDGTVRCWGFGGGGFQVGDGRLGYGNTNNVGDTPATTPDKAGAVNVGAGRRAVAISAGGAHTCAILDDGTVRCWGLGASGQLGYGNTNNIGSTPTTTPDTAGPVNLGPGRTAKAISAGNAHTCAILDDGSVRCWGFGFYGQLGYGNQNNVGATSTTTPETTGPVPLGPGRIAVAITAGDAHTCAILDDGSVRCWGLATYGRLGYPTLDSFGNQPSILAPSTVPVDLGPGRTALAISAGGEHTCALLDDHSVRCWGYGAYGQLGYCSPSSVGETNTPGSVGPVNLQPGDGGATCPKAAASATPPAVTTTPFTGPSTTAPSDQLASALRAQSARASALRRCLVRAHRVAKPRRARARTACINRYARRPGRVSALRARALSRTRVVLSFAASGTDGTKPPPAQTYLIEQSDHPIRRIHDFRAAKTLCHGYCRFAVTAVGTTVKLTITDLRPHSIHYYAIAARDNVTGRPGPRSAIEIRTH